MLNDNISRSNKISRLRRNLESFNAQVEAIKYSQNGLAEVAAWGLAYFFALLQEKNIFLDPSKVCHAKSIVEQLQILPAYNKQLESLLEMLAQHNFVAILKDRQYQVKSIAGINLEQLLINKNLLLNTHPELQANIKLLHLLLEHYLKILTGKEKFLNLLFPNGSFQYLIDLYKNNPAAKFYNKLTAKVIVDIIDNFFLTSESPINILEIGAGIGATSEEIFSLVEDSKVQYFYTDISPAFLSYGQNRFKKYSSFLNFSKFDINYFSEVQGLQNNSFDVIFSTNAVHNAHSMEEVLLKIHSLLKVGGILVLCEGTKISDYSTLVYGLSSGWWGFTDVSCRIKNSPLISLFSWKKLFNSSSFKFCFSLMDVLDGADALDHDIMVVRKI